jgi:hypothetical protein
MNSTLRTRSVLAGALIASLLVGAGCTGEIKTMWSGDPEDAYLDPSNPDELIVPGKPPIKNPMVNADMGTGVVDPDVEIEHTSVYVRRLTQLQYHNTVRQALGDYLVEEDMPNFSDAIPTLNFSNNPNFLSINDSNVTALYNASGRIAAKSVTENAALSACVSASDEACFEQLIEDLGAKLWRRPLTGVEISDLNEARQRVAGAGATRAEQAEFIVQALLLNIHTFYRTEIGEMASAAPGEDVQLDEYELAQALSYTLWNEPPDAALLELAASGELSQPEVYRAQVQRMVKDERVASAMTEFFADYLKLDKLFIKEKDAAFGLTPAAKEALVSGVREDLRAIFEVPGATMLDPFEATNFSVNGTSATFFGVDVTSAEFERVALDPNERYGVLTHPAFLSVHSGRKDSSIIKRGVFTLEQLLCQHLEPAPANIPPVAPEDLPADFDPDKVTTREALFVQHTAQTQCIVCHKTIDPAGYGFENYDGSGRWRTTEKDNIAINAAGSLDVSGEVLTYTTSVDYARAIKNSDAMRACLSRQFMSYVLGEEPGEPEQAAFLEAFNTSEGNLETILESVLMTPSFATRQTTQEQ